MDSDKVIVFLTGTLEAGGLERFISRVSIEAGQKKIFTPIVFCLRKRAGIFLTELQDHGIAVYEAPSGWERNLSSLIRLGTMIRSLQPHAVHSQVNFSLVQQFLAARLFTSARFLVTERNCYPLTGFSRLKRIAQFYFLKIFGTHYSGNSVAVAKYLAAMVRYPFKKIPVIPNGIEIPEANAGMREQIRSQHGWRKDDFVIGYVARFAGHKGQGYFVSVLEWLHKQVGDRVKVCFIGDGPERNTVQIKLQQIGLQRLVIFTGIIPNVSDYYQAFDCVTLLSDYEGMPNVVLEAMACGLPVVANPVGNVEELLGSGAGFINRSANPEITAGLFIALATSPATCAASGNLAREKIRKDFSLQASVRLLQNQYEV